MNRLNQAFNKRFNGYSPAELLQIEAAFLRGCGYELPFKRNSIRPQDRKDSEVIFDGLCEAIQVLCKLEGQDNVMDYSESLKHLTVANRSKLIEKI